MKKPLLILGAVVVLFLLGHRMFGYTTVYLVAYGAFSLMAAFMAATFFWLWTKRATPLALGMAFSWAGAACVMGWWWLINITEVPTWVLKNPVLLDFLAIYFVGVVLHFQVIGRSFGLPTRAALYPVIAAVIISSVSVMML